MQANYQRDKPERLVLIYFAGFGEVTSLDIRGPVAHLDC
jgi:hypothetical protein